MTADPRDGTRGTIGTMDGGRSRPDVPTAAGLALGAVADLLLADPRRGHPVAGFGAAAAALERRGGGGFPGAGAGAPPRGWSGGCGAIPGPRAPATRWAWSRRPARSAPRPAGPPAAGRPRARWS